MTQQELIEQHTKLVQSLKKKDWQVMQELTPQKADLLHMAVGISGEAGELLDAIKKHAIYGKELDLDNVIEELGDLEFYMRGIRSVLGVTRRITLMENIFKLQRRYPAGNYSNEDAIRREDKK